jgi:Cu/Ag efflux protein CusF
MKSLSKWVSAAAAVVLLAGTSAAGDAIYAGKVKSINANKKDVVLTADGKDTTFNLSDNVVVNRGGKESQSDLKVDDSINVLYDKGLLSSTVRYILVKEGDYKNSELERGAFKDYNADKKDVTFTDEYGHDQTFPAGDAKVRLNKEDSKVENLKIGDNVLAIVQKVGDKATLQALMVDRK